MVRSLRTIDVYPITTRTLVVLRVADVTPGMRRVTLGGPELNAHIAANGYPVAAFRSEGFDDEGKIFLKHPEAEIAVGATQADGVISWPRNNPHLLLRTYTVRRWDPHVGEIDLDFVNHGAGPATSWAYSVQPGEKIQWAGPTSSAGHPAHVDWTLIAGDETALPAIGRWLENWPAGARGQVFIEVAEASHRQLDLPVPAGVELKWLTREGASPGTTTLLFDAIRDANWWDGNVFAWVAGETLTLTPIRRWLRNEKGLKREQVEATGYWRRRATTPAEAVGQSAETTEQEDHKFHELTEILPGFAVRVAATIGLAGALSDQGKTLVGLAEETNTDPLGLAKLLRYLLILELVRETAGVYELTTLGRQLEVAQYEEGLNLDHAHAHRELIGALSLLSAVRTGHGDSVRWLGKEFTTIARERSSLLSSRVEGEADTAVYVASALSRAPVFAEIHSISVRGRGAGLIAEELVNSHSELEAIIVADSSEIDVLQRIHSPHERVTYEADEVRGTRIQRTEAALILDGVLAALPDHDAILRLRDAAASVLSGGYLLIFEGPLDPETASEHDYEDDLIAFSLHGGGLRTPEEYLSLFKAAGIGTPQRTTIGWGVTLYSFRR